MGSGPVAPRRRRGGFATGASPDRQFYGFIWRRQQGLQIAGHEVDDHDHVLDGPEALGAGLRALDHRVDPLARSVRQAGALEDGDDAVHVPADGSSQLLEGFKPAALRLVEQFPQRRLARTINFPRNSFFLLARRSRERYRLFHLWLDGACTPIQPFGFDRIVLPVLGSV